VISSNEVEGRQSSVVYSLLIIMRQLVPVLSTTTSAVPRLFHKYSTSSQDEVENMKHTHFCWDKKNCVRSLEPVFTFKTPSESWKKRPIKFHKISSF
jgi:hypothetical protein